METTRLMKTTMARFPPAALALLLVALGCDPVDWQSDHTPTSRLRVL
jgi:hypothetical protein